MTDPRAPGPPVDTLWMKGCLERLRAGDPAAQQELVLRAGDRLERLARAMLRRFPVVAGREQTADVLQNAVIRLLRALRRVEPDTTRDFFNLAAAQIRRELLDLARKYRRPERRARSLEVCKEVDEEGGGPRSEPEDGDLELWSTFHEHVERLPAEQREVVSLRFYHGMEQGEISRLLGVSDRTVRRWWAAACESLRRTAGGAPTV